jgi:hypothetical protein
MAGQNKAAAIARRLSQQQREVPIQKAMKIFLSRLEECVSCSIKYTI